MKRQNPERLKDMGRGREIYAEIKAIPPLVVRADGRNFKRVLSDKFQKPYDKRFAKGMAEAVKKPEAGHLTGLQKPKDNRVPALSLLLSTVRPLSLNS